MSSYELLQESPGLYFLILFISLIVTVFVYGAFPVIYAKKLKTPITSKQYKKRCYWTNAIGIVFFFVLNGAASAAPYMLWTWIFSNKGLKTLEARNLLSDALPTAEEPCEQAIKTRFCRKCGAKLEEDSRFCRKCGTEIIEEKDL